MPGPIDTAPCEVCGKVFTRERRYRRGEGRRPHRCIDCTTDVVVDAINQVKCREGPAYDAWRRAMLRAADRLRDSG